MLFPPRRDSARLEPENTLYSERRVLEGYVRVSKRANNHVGNGREGLHADVTS